MRSVNHMTLFYNISWLKDTIFLSSNLLILNKNVMWSTEVSKKIIIFIQMNINVPHTAYPEGLISLKYWAV